MVTVRHNQFKITFILSYDSYSMVASVIVTKNFHLLRTFLEKEASKEESDNFFPTTSQLLGGNIIIIR